MAGQPVRTMQAGEGFGEIALLADVPRTAAVRACGPVELLAVERTAFLAAVLGHATSARVAWATARRFEPRLPSGVDGPGIAVGPAGDVRTGPGRPG
jgi:CRP-like cAMP-binding protein